MKTDLLSIDYNLICRKNINLLPLVPLAVRTKASGLSQLEHLFSECFSCTIFYYFEL